jgi:hypothetical protein
MTTETKENYELVLYRLDQIDRKLDSISRHYVTKEEFDEFKTSVKAELRKKSLFNVVNPVIASVTTAIVTFLIIEFLRRA